MEYVGNQNAISDAEVTHLKTMRGLIYDLRKSKTNLKNFIQGQSFYIDSLSLHRHSWQKEYNALVLQIDRLQTKSTNAGNTHLNEDDVTKIERFIKAMEFILTMAEKKILK